jgi:hypothetical protein
VSNDWVDRSFNAAYSASFQPIRQTTKSLVQNIHFPILKFRLYL